MGLTVVGGLVGSSIHRMEDGYLVGTRDLDTFFCLRCGIWKSLLFSLLQLNAGY